MQDSSSQAKKRASSTSKEVKLEPTKNIEKKCDNDITMPQLMFAALV